MAKPALTDIFGSDSIVITDPNDVPMTIDTDNPALVIPMTSLADGLLNVPASMNDAEKIWIALLSQGTAWYRSDNTEDPIIEATEIRESTVTRRNQRMRGYSFEFTAHKPLPATPVIDPDTIDTV